MRINKKYKLQILLLTILFSLSGFSQNLKSSKDTLEKHVYYLASEELKGRATGTEGQKKAAFYISNSFSRYDLSTLPNQSYFYYYSLKKKHKNSHVIKSNGNIIFWPWHFYFASSLNHNDTLDAKVKFCGYGTLDELKDLDLSNKTIAFIEHCPKQAFEKIKQIRNTYGNKNYMVLFPEKNADCEKAWSSDYELTYYDLPQRFNANLSGSITEEWAKPNAEDSLRIYYLFPNVMRNLFGKSDAELESFTKDNLKSETNELAQQVEINVSILTSYKDTIQKIVVENVGGIIYGEDTTQTVVITAHYDHIGEEMGKINYGADDNASGVSVLLESARILSEVFKENKPQRNILFMAFSGEEIGLYGSEAYVRDPIFPLNETVININMDMVGRWDSRHENDKDFVYLLTAGHNSKKHYKLGSKKIKTPYKFDVSNNPGAKERMIFKYGSDHYSFYQRNVPIAVFFTGLHDDYHTPKDTPEKLNYDNMTNISDLVTKYIYNLATDTVAYPLR